MAYRDVDDWHRKTAQRRYPPSPLPVAQHEWHGGGEMTFDSLPYRRPKDLIPTPDEITSSPGRSRISRNSSGASATVVETMPVLSRAQVPETYRRGRYPAPDYDLDLYAEEDEVVPTQGSRMSPRRGRSPRAVHHSRPRRVYEKSSTSSPSRSETDTDEDSATSISTEDERRLRRLERARREKEKEREERLERQGRQEKRARRAVVEEQRPPPDEKKTPKKRRKIREIVYVEEDDESTVHMPRRPVDVRSSSPSRHRSRLSRSASERHRSRPRSHSPVRTSSQHRRPTTAYDFVSKPSASLKRPTYRTPPARGDSDLGPSRLSRRHRPDVVYADSRLVRRSKTMSGAASHVTSHSTASSNKHSTSFVGHMLTGSARSRSPERPVKMDNCVICRDELRASKHPKLKCGHRMCDSCLKWSFQLSIKNLSSMPPKCCTSDYIPLEYVERLLSSDFKSKWNRKYLEYSTRNRIYCPSRRCGEWIRPGDMRRRGGRKCGSCRACGLDVCCSCKGRWHSSRDCPDDEDTTRFLEQAKEAGWQRCYKCSHMIQLEEGCNHMTCRCGAQFCMICGVKWKNCGCPWFSHETAEEDRLHSLPVPAVIQRLDRLDLTTTSRNMRPMIEAGPPPRSRSQGYDSRLVRRFEDNRDKDTRRLSSYEDDNVFDRGYGEIAGIGGTTVGGFLNNDYRRDSEDVFVSGPPVPPAPTPPAAFERPAPTDRYVSGVNRARGLPPDSMGQRLAERFSEYRASPAGPSRTGMMAAPPPHAASSLGPITAPPLGSPPMGPPPPMTAAMGMGPPPPIPLLRRHTMEEETYNSARTTRPSERVVPGRMIHDYEREAALHAPRSRRRPYAEPKSSTLAGLTGPGRGMNRVFEWRNHVHPGMPEDTRA